MSRKNQRRINFPKNLFQSSSTQDEKVSHTGRKGAFSDLIGQNHTGATSNDASGKSSDAKEAWSGDFDEEEDAKFETCPKNILNAAIILTAASLVLATCAFGAPYWTSHAPSAFNFKTSEGLLMACAYPYTANITCGWLYFTKEPKLVITTAILWLLGTLSLTVFGVMSCCLCTTTCRGTKLTNITAIGAIFQTLCFLVAVILWGVNSGRTFNQQEGTQSHDWAFYLALLVSIMSSVISALLLKLMCIFRKSSTQIQSELV